MNTRVEKALNEQIKKEAESSHFYLAIASWAEEKGLNGTATFFYAQSDEERFHMLKLIHFVNERGGKALIPGINAPQNDFDGIKQVFGLLLEHEVAVTESINKLVEICLEEKDYTTQNFLQWYVAEQLEEEAQAKTILDRINLTGEDKGGLYLFDRDMEQMASQKEQMPEQ